MAVLSSMGFDTSEAGASEALALLDQEAVRALPHTLLIRSDAPVTVTLKLPEDVIEEAWRLQILREDGYVEALELAHLHERITVPDFEWHYPDEPQLVETFERPVQTEVPDALGPEPVERHPTEQEAAVERPTPSGTSATPNSSPQSSVSSEQKINWSSPSRVQAPSARCSTFTRPVEACRPPLCEGVRQ